MAQRISRAKRTVSGVRFDQPGDVATVLRVLYLVFNEGYSGDVDLAAEAIRLTRQLAAKTDHAEVAGLLALMLLHHARRAGRTAPDGSSCRSPSRTERVGHPPDRRGRRDPAGGPGPRPAGRVPGAGRHRRAPRRRAHRRGDRLGADRRVVRRAGAAHRQPGRPAQPRRRGRRGGRPAGRAGRPGGSRPSLPRYAAVAAYLHERDGDLVTAARLYAEAARSAPNLPERDHLTRQAARLNSQLRR